MKDFLLDFLTSWIKIINSLTALIVWMIKVSFSATLISFAVSFYIDSVTGFNSFMVFISFSALYFLILVVLRITDIDEYTRLKEAVPKWRLFS